MTPDSFDIQGHRGARGLYPENTIPAFVRALDLGVTTLEMDVVISQDHQVVVSHEPWFSREICLRPDGSRIPLLRERKHRIFRMTYAEIARYDCGSLRPRGFSRQQNVPAAKPLLADVIDEAEAHAEESGRAAAFYSIETKSRPEWDGIYHPDPGTFARLLVEVVEEKGTAERTIVQSFDVRTLQRVKRMNPSIRLSLLVDRKAAADVDANFGTLGFVPSIYSPHHASVDAALVALVHERGPHVVPWTVNDAARMVELRDMGADGLITDYPDVAVREL